MNNLMRSKDENAQTMENDNEQTLMAESIKNKE